LKEDDTKFLKRRPFVKMKTLYKKVSNSKIFYKGTMPRRFVPEQYVLKRQVSDISSLEQCGPWMMCPLDIVCLGHVVPDQCVLTLDFIEVLDKLFWVRLVGLQPLTYPKMTHKYVSV
jgi:hypothetical protein